MAVTWLGVRHHSPACARLARRTIERLRPAYVLVEGPADVGDRIGELLLGHEPPVAIFSHYRDEERVHASWSPFCAYSPEWVALHAGRAAGAELRFIDLPAWHPAFGGLRNRYADAENRYAQVTERLCRTFEVDNTDVLWDHLFEIDAAAGDEELAARLGAYFDLLRGEAGAGPADTAREEYMAEWVRAAEAAAGDRPVVVLTGGFHTPAVRTLAAEGGTDWPDVPAPPDGSTGGSFLVPYSFRRLDAFTGYQAGMPSPEYYQRLWEDGPDGAAAALTETVVTRLRNRRQVVSTADLIAARTLTEGLTRLRGHSSPARTDLLDGLVAALVNDDLDQRLPWTSRGVPAPGAHPAVAEMVAALSGDRVGRLHPDTPAPPLVHDVAAELERLGLDRGGEVALSLTAERDLARSRALHRLRVLRVPGFTRLAGPATGADPVLAERWEIAPHDAADGRLPALIEAGAYGPTLLDAAAAALEERAADAGTGMGELAGALFDAALCGCADQSGRIAAAIAAAVGGSSDVAGLGAALDTVLGLWRHDRVLGTARSPLFGTVIEECARRLPWLLEGMRGGPAPADPARLRAVAALRDALLHAAPPPPRAAALTACAGTPAPATPEPPTGAATAVTSGTPVPGAAGAPASGAAGTPASGAPAVTSGAPSLGAHTPGTPAAPTPDTPAPTITGASAPGMPAPAHGIPEGAGTPTPGTPTPGTPAPGVPRAPAPDTPETAASTPAPGAAAPGTPAPAAPAPAAPALGAPDMPAPGTTGAPAPGVPGASVPAPGTPASGGLGGGGGLDLDRAATLGFARRVAADGQAPPDLRGAAFGLARALGDTGDPARAVLGAADPGTLGDWLAGLFALARQEVLEPGAALLGVLDELIGGLDGQDFLVALPALRQAFVHFPPRERAAIADLLLERRGLRGSARVLLRAPADPLLLAEARALEERVDRALAAAGLTGGEPA